MSEANQHSRTASFYASPAEALQAPREELLYLACLHGGTGVDAPDFLAVVDAEDGRIVHETHPPARVAADRCSRAHAVVHSWSVRLRAVMHPVARHVLVACEGSRQGDEAVRQAADMAARMGARLSLIAVAVTEQAHIGWGDLRSVYWNGVEQELAARDVARARRLLGPGCVADIKLVGAPSVSSGIADAAKRWGADLIVLPAQRRVVPRSRHQRARQVRRRIPPEVALVTAAS